MEKAIILRATVIDDHDPAHQIVQIGQQQVTLSRATLEDHAMDTPNVIVQISARLDEVSRRRRQAAADEERSRPRADAPPQETA